MTEAHSQSFKPIGKAAAKPVRVALALCAIAVVALGVGFFIFVANIPAPSRLPPPRAEGIVALTGDSARVRDAVALLAAQRGRRLLITGVNRTTTRAELAALSPHERKLFQCCIDLGYLATNTAGNAAETRAWAKREGYRRSLIIVTSTYHMPRAMEDMRAALPSTLLIPYAVSTPKLEQPGWWRDPSSLSLLAREYLKFLFAYARTEVLGRRWLPRYASAARSPTPRIAQ